jgi:hypothetical protein
MSGFLVDKRRQDPGNAIEDALDVDIHHLIPLIGLPS